jgi:hypothetical protein
VSHSSKSPAGGQITGAPFITLVDVDGFAVPSAERDIPHVEPDPTDPADWPAWCDDWYWEPTDPAEASAAAAALEDLPLPALCGGSDEAFVPSEADWADYRAWCAEVDAREEIAAAEAAHNPMWGYE